MSGRIIKYFPLTLSILMVMAGIFRQNVSASLLEAPQKTEANDSILNYKFTNELGKAVRLDDFRGQALAITFFYTRCPMPNFCPRLSKNFQDVQEKLAVMTNAPMNWHLISVSFDADFDSPETLKLYGQKYHYDPIRWSFLTGPAEKIGQLARASGVQFESDGATITHNFRTLIIDAAGHLQMVFPMGGDFSDQIVAQLIKGAAVTKGPVGKPAAIQASYLK